MPPQRARGGYNRMQSLYQTVPALTLSHRRQFLLKMRHIDRWDEANAQEGKIRTMPQTETKRLHGAMPAIFTPLDGAGNLALDVLPAFLEFQRTGGMTGVIVCGTNGEGTALSVAERKITLETVMPHRGDLTVIAGTGAASITDAIELTRHAAQVGADGALVLPPFFMKNPTDAGLAAYFRAVLDSADLPMLLYNIPQFSAVPITDGLLALLADHPNLAGIKDSAGDWTRTQEFITRYPALSIFTGSDTLAAQGLAAGGAGIISGGANAFPEIVAAVYRAHQAGTGTGAAQNRLAVLSEILRRYPFVAVGKSILAHRGLPRMGVRPPIVPLEAAQEEALLTELRTAHFI